MAKSIPHFAALGKKSRVIPVRLSYELIDLLSDGLYASPNKAIEELVTNSFDAGASHVIVLRSPNLHATDASIVVIDDGSGMDPDGFEQHWEIGRSTKRNIKDLPKNREQIGKFGIGKLATYVLAQRFTHISKKGNRYYSNSMDYTEINRRRERKTKDTTPIKTPVHLLTEEQAREALAPWLSERTFQNAKMPLFGKKSPRTWTVAIMSDLKEKVHDLVPHHLEWVLRTALPLRDDFEIFLDGKQLESSKQGKGLAERWVLGRDLTELARPAPKKIELSELADEPADSPTKYGLNIVPIGRVTGYVEAYKDLLTNKSKSEEVGRSHGFFVYVRGRLVNEVDEYFDIDPNELRHGTFGRLRIVVHMDGLDSELRSNRENLREGTKVVTARDVLKGIFYSVRKTVEAIAADASPEGRLAKRLAEAPASISRRPLVTLARAVYEGKAKSKYLRLPEFSSAKDREQFLTEFERQSKDDAAKFVHGAEINNDASPDDVIAIYDAASNRLRLNALHPFVATFYEQYVKKNTSLPLELLAMAEILLEAQLYEAQLKPEEISEVLIMRDRLLRVLADGSGHEGANAIARSLSASRNSPDGLEANMCKAFKSLGFSVTRIGGKGKPDGVAVAVLSADKNNHPRRYSVCLEAKSKLGEGKVSAKAVGTDTLARHRKAYGCDHTVVVGASFQLGGADSALAVQIADNRELTAKAGEPKTITLITIDALARLVKAAPVRQVSLPRIREMLKSCSLPDDVEKWIKNVEQQKVANPPYKRILQSISSLAESFQRSRVDYGSLRANLLPAGVKFENNDELRTLCIGMAQMAPGMVAAEAEYVELDQNPENVLAAIEAVTVEYDPAAK